MPITVYSVGCWVVGGWFIVEWVSILIVECAPTVELFVVIVVDTIVISIVVVDTFIVRRVLNGVSVSSGACPAFFPLLAEACKECIPVFFILSA